MNDSEDDDLITLKQLVGSLVFAAREPLTVAEIRRNLTEVASDKDSGVNQFDGVKPAEIAAALDELRGACEGVDIGIHLVETSRGFAFQSDANCGPWLRHLLQLDKPVRLSRTVIETLAIIAYRQPTTRSEVESIRGVNVDHAVRTLLDMQFVHVIGRSELPGRPMLYGTTQMFLDHFGLKDLDELPDVGELRRIEVQRELTLSAVEPDAEGEDDEDDEEEGDDQAEAAEADGAEAEEPETEDAASDDPDPEASEPDSPAERPEAP